MPGTVPVGWGPDGMALDGPAHTLYVANVHGDTKGNGSGGPRPGSPGQPHMDVPVGEPVRRIRWAELLEWVPGFLRYAAGRRVADIMHEHDLLQACPGERIEDPVSHGPDRCRSYAAAARCHRGPVADLGGLALADPAGLLTVLQSDIPRQDTVAGIVPDEYGEAQPVTVAPAAVLAREPPGRVALAGRPGPALRPAGQRGPDRALTRS